MQGWRSAEGNRGVLSLIFVIDLRPHPGVKYVQVSPEGG
jgi:hypothetical protein